MTNANSNTKTYLIKDESTNLIKIGKSKNPQARLKALSASNLNLKLIHVFDFNIESYLHKTFKPNNVGGEWFNISADSVIDFVLLNKDIASNSVKDKNPINWDEFDRVIEGGLNLQRSEELTPLQQACLEHGLDYNAEMQMIYEIMFESINRN